MEVAWLQYHMLHWKRIPPGDYKFPVLNIVCYFLLLLFLNSQFTAITSKEYFLTLLRYGRKYAAKNSNRAFSLGKDTVILVKPYSS